MKWYVRAVGFHGVRFPVKRSKALLFSKRLTTTCLTEQPYNGKEMKLDVCGKKKTSESRYN